MRNVHLSFRNAMDPGFGGTLRARARAIRGSIAATAAACALTFLSGLGWAAESMPDGGNAPAVDQADPPQLKAPDASGLIPGADATSFYGASATQDAATTAAIAATTAAGRTPGAFGVTSSGAATYRIPIWTPPGVGSVELDLALVYNSRGGDGVMGQGWALSGLSAVTRCNRTMAQDGAPAAVMNTLADRYCLDGQQLKLVSGAYGAPGSVYATEIESFSRIVANGTAGNGPASFTVTSRNGLVYEYGVTPDAQVFAGASGTVRTWALSRVHDRAATTDGNSISITYVNEAQNGAYTNGSYRVSSITYPTTVSGQGPFYRVSFGYSARPTTDTVVGYLAGNAVLESNQLDSITIRDYATGATIKTYNLSYMTGAASSRLQLRSVQECSATGCLAPTTVGYQNGSKGWAATYVTTGYQASGKTGLFPVDLNGDGITDILYPSGIGDSVMRWWVMFGQPGGYGAPVDTGITLDAGVRIIPGRFLGNGRSQFLVPLQSTWHVVDYSGSTFSKASTGMAPAGEFTVADVDGDGLDDLVSYDSTSADCFKVRRNVSAPAAGSMLLTFAPTSESIGRPPKGGVYGSGSLRVADLNGDGRDDMVVYTFVSTKRGGSWITPFLSNGFGVPFTVGTPTDFFKDAPLTFGDWNGDGCADLLQVASISISNCAGGFGGVNTGAAGVVYDTYGNATVLAADWDEDGRTDLLYVSSYGGSGNRWYVVRSTGNGAAVPVSTGVGAPSNTSWFAFDADGDGKTDLGYRDDNHNGSMRYYRHNAPGAPADLATSFSDGFGMSQSPSYVSIAIGNYTKHADAVFPEIDFRGPLYVVSQFAATDGTGSTYQNQFQYYGARAHLQGRGFEGFHSQRTYDSRSGTYTFEYLQRAFPYTGMHTQRTVLQSNLSSKLSERVATVDRRLLGVPGAEERVFPFLSAVTDSRFEAGGPLDGVLVTQATESYVYDDFANRTLVRRIVTDKDPGSPFSGLSWQTTATSAFANDVSSNCLGLPTSMVVTQVAPGQASRTRTTGYTVDTGPCRITQQVIEPGSPALKVTTTFGFDACGNVSSLQVVGSTPGGSPMPPRTTRFGYGARCQLPESMTNALGQTTSVAYRYDFGVPLVATDPNGISTRWQYDDFGRRTQETRPDQTTTSWSFESCATGPCWGANDLRFRVYETSQGSVGDTYQQRELFYDGYDRLRSNQRFRVLGVWTTENFSYDSLGRLVARYRPYSSGSNGYLAWTYDLLDRVTAQKLYQPNGTLDRTTALSYAGRTVRITDPLGRTRVRVLDVAGRLRRVTDPYPGGTTYYDYDSLGGLNRIQDPIGAVSSGTYNARGFRTQWADADRGPWTFAGNSLNELVSWTDARGQSFAATYDALGRMTSRTEPDGTSTWTWGDSPAARNVGHLQAVAGYGYTESLAYDGVGRVASRAITTDQGYQYDYTYNSIGALDTVTYPASPVPTGQGGARFKLQYAYSYGAPVRITDVTEAPSTSRMLWTLNAANDYSAATSETLGANLLSVASGYKTWTNEIASRQSGVVPATSNRQNLAYQWDAAGNLTQRQDLNQALSESFALDALDRIQSSTLNGTVNFAVAYDASGNITSRSDTGSFGYGDPAHPHAVTAAGSHAYTYDANGNQITRDGASQAWASFNLPVLLAQPIGGTTYQSQFSYGPDHRRWRQIASYSNGTETTLYVGGLLEKESTTSTGQTYWRHYVPTPSGLTIVVSRNSDASTSTSYLLTDHLGSSDAVLDASGNLVARSSFAAFGARRGGDWSSRSAPDWAGIANTSRHGYTGHEHLDNLALIHMNGRVYDPVAGRFLSVDPVLGDLGDSQQLNPYAYAGNRPLAYTDPSGHDVVCGGLCVAVAASVIKTASNYILGGSKSYRPPATNMPGQPMQAGMGMCNPGRATPACGGWLLSATASGRTGAAIPSSTWVNEVDPADEYARENLEQLFIDLGTNAIDVVILAPYYDARGTYEATRDGDYLVAVIYAGMTICDVAPNCAAIGAPAKAVARAAKRIGKVGTVGADMAGGLVHSVPKELARVVAGDRAIKTLGRADADDVFVVAADDIAGLNAAQLSDRLTIPASDTFTIIRFPTPPTGLASPIFRTNPGFQQGGLTRGGAREYIIPNGPIPSGATITVVGP